MPAPNGPRPDASATARLASPRLPHRPTVGASPSPSPSPSPSLSPPLRARRLAPPGSGTGRGRRTVQLALTLLTAAAVAGCAAPATRWLALPMLPAAAPSPSAASDVPSAAAAATPQARTLSVRRVVLPEYLQATGVRYRADDSLLAEWPDTLWAERLEVAASRRLTEALRRELPGWTLCEGVCPGTALGPAVLVEFTALDYLRPQRRMDAQVRWRAVAAAPESGLVPALLRAARRPGNTGPSVYSAPAPGPGANVPAGAAPADAASTPVASPASAPVLPLPSPRDYSVPVTGDTAQAQAEAIAQVLDRVARDTARALQGGR